MHFSKKEIELFVNNELTDDRKCLEIKTHLEECEFCREYFDNYRLYIDSLKQAETEPLPPEAEVLANKLQRAASQRNIIDLVPLIEQAGQETYLAADGESEKQPDITSLATFFSEDPELVLRVMRDNDKKRDYLQLIGEDTELISHALIQIPDIDFEHITDETGRVELEKPLAGDISRLKWQVKMPEAVFDLEPLQYDPD
ncbi:MAG: hypothetical protein JXA92_06325, partial [candidate division Zixibacteria bacterium]|nr:hypothetical protein [candidate division Zixibacteria bacterium]